MKTISKITGTENQIANAFIAFLIAFLIVSFIGLFYNLIVNFADLKNASFGILG